MEAQLAPQNVEAEDTVLGAILISETALDKAAEVIRPSDFYKPSNGIIFETALRMAEHGEPVDVLTLANQLTKSGTLEAVGGRTRIHELAAVVPATANVTHYARMIREASTLRKLLRAGQDISRLAVEQPGELEEVLAQAEDALSKASQEAITSEFRPITSALERFAERIRRGLAGDPERGLMTAFHSLDELLGGMYPGQLILVAARPGAGKSVLAQNIAENLADDHKHVAFLTLEMSEDELIQRAVSRYAGVAVKRVLWGNPPEGAREKIVEAYKRVAQRKEYLWVSEDTSINPATFRAHLRRQQRHPGLDLAIVDYIQLMSGGGKYENRQQEVSAISRSLKLLAKDLHIPIIACCQMSRAIDHRADRRPVLSDLRESGALEQDADVVVFIHRDPDAVEGGTAELIVAKNRMGASGTAELAFVSRSTTFKNIPKGETCTPAEENQTSRTKTSAHQRNDTEPTSSATQSGQRSWQPLTGTKTTDESASDSTASTPTPSTTESTTQPSSPQSTLPGLS